MTITMSPPVAEVDNPAELLRIRMLPAVPMTQDQFFDLCQQNRDLHLERTAQGELIIMVPTGGGSGARNAWVTGELHIWRKRHGSGAVFDSSTGFTLPNGANRSPDASWISQERLVSISDKLLEKFLPLCPDFVIELLSPTDSLRLTSEKMAEYIANGASLGWLINPRTKQVHVYRPGQEVEILDNPTSVSADPELPGFELDLTPIWQQLPGAIP